MLCIGGGEGELKSCLYTTQPFRFRCEHCAKAFSNSKRLNEHARVYHAKDWTCTYDGCAFVGIDYKAFEDHLVEVHGEPRSRKCSVCNIWFTTKAGLKTHLASVHNGELRYDCWCGYGTNQKSKFEVHKGKDDCKPKPVYIYVVLIVPSGVRQRNFENAKNKCVKACERSAKSVILTVHFAF